MSLTLELVYSPSWGRTLQCPEGFNTNSLLWLTKTQTSPSPVCVLGTLQFTVPWLFLCPASWRLTFHICRLLFNTIFKGAFMQILESFFPGSSLLSGTLTLKFQTPHSSKIPASISSYALLEFPLPSLQSGKCLWTDSPDEHKVHIIYFSSLMNHSPALPVVYCPETVTSYISCSFLIVYCPITVTPSQSEAEISLYEIWLFIKIKIFYF